MQQKIVVTFVSQRNSFRSILAAACLAHLDRQGRFLVRSCGQPGRIAESVHPAAVGALHAALMTAPSAAPRSWDDLLRANPVHADFVITLDTTTQHLQPRWPGQPDHAEWAYADAVAEADPESIAHSAIQTLYSLKRRLELLVSLPMHGIDKSALSSDLRDMAYMR